VQTILYRLEAKNAVKRTKKIGNAHIFEAVVSQTAAHRKVIDELLGLFGGRAQPLMAHLIESGRLTLADIEDARKALRETAKKE
jgi:predicted transcriptional regulator